MDKNTNGNTTENINANLYGIGNNEQTAGGVIEMALAHHKIIVTTMILTLTGAFIYLLTATPIYTSDARIYAEQTGPRMLSEYEGFMTGSKNYLYTQKELMVSTPIISEAVSNTDIKNMKTFEKIDNVVAYIKNKMKVSVGKKDDIITVSFDSPYPQEAAAVVNAVTDSYVDYHSTHKRSTVLEVLKILQKEKVKRDSELSEQIKNILEFTQKNGMITFNNKNEGDIVIQRLAKLSEALTQGQLETINAKANYEAILNMKDDITKIKQLAMAQQNAVVPILYKDKEIELESQIRKLEVELTDLKTLYTDEHPAVKSIEKKIALATEQLNKHNSSFADSYIEVQKQKCLMAQQTEEQLAKSYDLQLKEAQEAGTKNAEYTVLCSEMKRTERLCEILDERIKQLNVSEDTGALNINILEVARVPDGPSKPQRVRVMAMAFVLGLMLSIGLVILREQFDSRLRSTEDVTNCLGVSILGTIPTISGEDIAIHNTREALRTIKNITIKACGVTGAVILPRLITQKIKKPTGGSNKGEVKSRFNRGSYKGDIRAAWNELTKTVKRVVKQSRNKPTETSSEIDTKQTAIAKSQEGLKNKIYKQKGQQVFLEPKSHAAEAYRTIRTSIFFGVPEGQAKTILVTSPTSGDGKSTLVSNLALAIAQAGQKTIVLDCDFRKSIQHTIFEADGNTGISNVITGNMTLNEAIQNGPVENLHILTCGTEVPNPSELLNSNSFIRLLNELSEQYDRIIIDSPPVLPVADSHILGAISDISILVLRAEKSTRKASRAARDTLMNVGAHLLGVVVNDVPMRHRRYGYYSRYGYGYGYGDGYGYGYNNKKEKAYV